MHSSWMPLAGIALAASSAAMAADGPKGAAPDAAEVPDLRFEPTPEMAKDFGKYFVFHRDDTDFDTAYADIRECDGYARGLSFTTGAAPAYYPYAGTMAGAVGGLIGSAIVDLTAGAAKRREQRRIIMRTCMGYKGYALFGLPKDIWSKFNFEEGNVHVEEERRQRLLKIQARVASGPRPTVGEIEG